MQTRLLPLILSVLAIALAANTVAGHAQEQEPSLALDADPAGNTPTEVGTIDECVAVNEGDTFQVDIVIQEISNLLAFEIPVSYDDAVLEVVDRDVDLFLSSSPSSSVLDVSDFDLPDSDGTYTVRGFDSADPLSPESGEGALASITFRATSAGASPLRIEKRDFDGDGTFDRGALLRDTDNVIVGDEDEDTFFDGPVTEARVHVGESCQGTPLASELSSQANPESSADGGGGIGIGVIIGATLGGVALLTATAGIGTFLIRRRSRPTPSA